VNLIDGRSFGVGSFSEIPVLLARPHPVADLIEDTLQLDPVVTGESEGSWALSFFVREATFQQKKRLFQKLP